MKKNIAIAAICILPLLAIGGLIYLIKTDVQMVFPKKPHGTFVQQPQLVNENGEQKIIWILPEECTSASYEVQEVGYTLDTEEGFWGGVTGVSCTKQERGVVCEAELHSGMQAGGGPWNIQAAGHDCESGAFYFSEVVTTL